MLLALFCLWNSYLFAAAPNAAPEILTEIKVALNPQDFLSFLQTQNLDFDHSEEGAYYYYDTAGLDLFNHSLVLRGRTWRGMGKGDFTVKIRPLDLRTVDEEWYKTPGFKCEYDLGATAPVPACEVKEERAKQMIFDVAKVQRPLSDMVSKNQGLFPDFFLGAPPAWDSLLVMGPVRTFVWKVYFSKDAPKATLEYWLLPNEQAMGEVSMKVPGEGAYVERDRLIDYLKANGVVRYSLDETKTHWVLDYFSSQFKRLYQGFRHAGQKR